VRRSAPAKGAQPVHPEDVAQLQQQQVKRKKAKDTVIN